MTLDVGAIKKDFPLLAREVHDTRLVYLAQTDDPALLRAAEAAAERLGLTMTVERTGYGELEPAMVRLKQDRR